ncbi:MAG: tetratricopeptide repeat protein, partial [Pseudomonadota bacterium]
MTTDRPAQKLEALIAAGQSLAAVDEARHLLEAAASLAPADLAAIHHELGRAQTRNRDFTAADEAFAKAIDLAPQQPVYHLNRGIANYGAGALDAAAIAFDRACRISPDFTYAIYWRGYVAAQQGQ